VRYIQFYKKKFGPRKAIDGNWIAHSILGDVEDYEEMEVILRPKTEDADKTIVPVTLVLKIILII
jgi:hypothetical protein